MIVATSIAHKAEALYSHDIKLKNFANGSIPVLEIPKKQVQQSLLDFFIEPIASYRTDVSQWMPIALGEPILQVYMFTTTNCTG